MEVPPPTSQTLAMLPMLPSSGNILVQIPPSTTSAAWNKQYKVFVRLVELGFLWVDKFVGNHQLCHQTVTLPCFSHRFWCAPCLLLRSSYSLLANSTSVKPAHQCCATDVLFRTLITWGGLVTFDKGCWQVVWRRILFDNQLNICNHIQLYVHF